MKAENQVYKEKIGQLNGLEKSKCYDLEKTGGIMGEKKILLLLLLAAIMFKKQIQIYLN